MNRNHTNACLKEYGTRKHINYLINYLRNRFSESKMEAIKNYDYILIDDNAKINGDNSYDLEISVKAYNSKIVSKEIANDHFRDNELLLLCGFFFDKCFSKYFNNDNLLKIKIF